VYSIDRWLGAIVLALIPVVVLCLVDAHHQRNDIQNIQQTLSRLRDDVAEVELLFDRSDRAFIVLTDLLEKYGFRIDAAFALAHFSVTEDIAKTVRDYSEG
jgi:hypothetical protein